MPRRWHCRLREEPRMIKQGVILLALVAVAFAAGYGTKTAHSKNTFQAQSQYPSVAAFHSAKAPEGAAKAPSPYAFNYEADGSSRQESSDSSGKVKGSYRVTNEDGSVRVVNYVADENGFRADVDTNEPGTGGDSPADVLMKSAAPERIAQAPARQKTAQRFSQKTTKTHMQQQPFQSSMAGKTHSAAQEKPHGSGWKSPSRPQPSAAQHQGHAAQGYGQASAFQQQKRPQPVAPLRQEHIQQSQFSDSKPIPYSFSYDAQLEDGGSSRTESSDGSGKVTGSYTVMGPDGRKRVINYEADHEGFRAKVDTNEFGTKSESPADVQFMSSAPQEAPMVHPYVANGHRTAPAVDFRAQQGYGGSGKTSHQAKTMYDGQSSVQYGAPMEDKPQPYSFSYDAQLEDGSMSRTESADGSGKVVGSYSMAVADGRQRTVDYLADHQGFRATVNTNEFGTKADSPADVQFYSSATFDEPAPYSSPNAHKASPSASMHSSSHVQQQPIQFDMGNGNGMYSYSYQSQLEDGGSSAHSESADGSGKVSGHYSMSNSQGMRRKVDYTSGSEGFRASVDTNEFGTRSDSPAHVTFTSSAPEAPRAPVAFKAPAAHQSAGSAGTSYATQQQVEPVQSFRPSPYAFNYEAEASGGGSSRQESSDASGVVTGSYEVRNEDGSVRVVEYIADENGFRANVKTNEAGTKSDHPADVVFKSDAVPHSAPVEQQKLRAEFPPVTHTRKTSEISQRSIDAFA